MRMMLTRRQHVAASYAILVCVALAAFFSIVSATFGKRVKFAAHLTDLRETYATSLTSLARSAAVRKQIDERAQIDIGAFLFDAETHALAGADLQGRLRQLLEAEGGTIVSSAFRPALADAGPLDPITVTVRLRCSVDTLVRVLHGLEGQVPVLFIGSLVVQKRHRPDRQPRDTSDELDVELDVTGYLDRRVKS